MTPGKHRVQRQVIPRSDHQVSRRDISPNCLKVLYRLNEAGYEAYIVGGGVRDILLGLHPKDFDVATDATPEQIKDLFRNSRIIGRRFRIVHVRFGREIIEVSTFRAAHTDSVQVEGESLSRKVKHLDSARSSSGMLLRDNVYGDIEDDAIRRDFTVNALYYTVQNYEIHDFLNGLKDIQARTLRMIGEPLERYREDPVRTLRAVRLAAKLDFSIDPDTAKPIAEAGQWLESIPAARLFDECMKLFFAGKALPTYQGLCQYGLFAMLFPASAEMLADGSPEMERFVELALSNTDKRLAESQRVSPYFLLAALLWPAVEKRRGEYLAEGLPEQIAMQEAAQDIIMGQIERTSIPKRFSIPMREIWELQLRLPRRNGKRADTLLRHRRFRAAYDFLLLREEAGKDLDGLGQWWTDYQEADQDKRAAMKQALGKNPRHSLPRQRRVKSRSGKKTTKPSS